ncbi:MAG: hypothetical protein GXP33_09395 [Spirochaetes bacterium]|nr:hypothetical protein [Spirochaetota bacterium]
MNKRFVLIASFIFIAGALSSLYAVSYIPSSSVILSENVIDLRANRQLKSLVNNRPGRYSTPEDLKIGSIFFTVDNKARKVVDIYERNGKTIIETIKPRPEEVFLGVHVPDFSVKLDRSDIDMSSLGKGVTLLPPGAGKKDMLSSDFLKPSNLSKSKSVSWLETDPDTAGMDIIALNIDIPLWKSSLSTDDLELIKKIKASGEEKKDEKKKQSSGDSESEESTKTKTGGKPEVSFGASGEIHLLGTLRVAAPKVTGGLDMPSFTVTWVHDWWIIYHPEFHFNKGYLKVDFTAAQQFDFRLTGSLSLEAGIKIPIFAIEVIDPDTTLFMIIGFYAKISLSGTISIAVETSEYTKLSAGATCDLIWPFIPVKFSAHQTNYGNFAFRPTVAAEARLQAGLYLGGSFGLADIDFAGAEAGGGAYIQADGYMEPLGIMGYDTKIGSYGNFNNWILDLTAEAGAYVEIDASILTIGIPIYSHDWPFWQWHKSWEF